jgi:hypothetical protein
LSPLLLDGHVLAEDPGGVVTDIFELEASTLEQALENQRERAVLVAPVRVSTPV